MAIRSGASSPTIWGWLLEAYAYSAYHWLRSIYFHASFGNSGLNENMGCLFHALTIKYYYECMEILFLVKVVWPLLFDEPLDTILVITATTKLLLLLMVILNFTIN